MGEEEIVTMCGMCRLPRKAADAPSLETFKVRLDGTLTSKGPFQPQPFYDSMN